MISPTDNKPPRRPSRSGSISALPVSQQSSQQTQNIQARYIDPIRNRSLLVNGSTFSGSNAPVHPTFSPSSHGNSGSIGKGSMPIKSPQTDFMTAALLAPEACTRDPDYSSSKRTSADLSLTPSINSMESTSRMPTTAGDAPTETISSSSPTQVFLTHRVSIMGSPQRTLIPALQGQA